MSQWVDRIQKHPVWALLESTGPSFDKVLEQRDRMTADAVDSLERLKAVVSFCKKRLTGTDPVLVFPAVLDAVNNSLTQLNAHVAAFTSSVDSEQLNAANAQADGILANIVSIIGPITPDDMMVIRALLNFKWVEGHGG